MSITATGSYIIGTGLATELTQCTSVTADSSGNVYVTGFTSTSGVTLGGNTKYGTSYDVFVAKYNSSGVLQWGTFIGDNGSNRDQGNGISTDAAGNVFVTGFTRSPGLTLSGVSGNVTKLNGSDQDGFVVKYNANGVLQWGTFIGGVGSDTGYTISNDSAGNVYVGASISSTDTLSGVSGNYTGPSSAILKYDTNGVLQWGISTGVNPRPAIDPSGNIYSAGNAGSVSSVVKYNSSGVLQWSTIISDNSNNIIYGSSIDNAGNVYAVGQTSVSGFTLSGVSGNVTKLNGSDYDAFIVKCNADGVIQWGAFISGSTQDQLARSACDASGNVYVTGFTYSSGLTLSGTQGGFTKATTSQEGFVAMYDSNGVLQWASLLNSLGFSVHGDVVVKGNTLIAVGQTNTSTPTAPLTTNTSSATKYGLVQTFRLPSVTTNSNLPCFAKGTRVLTQNGYKAIELLENNDYILTPDRRVVDFKLFKTTLQTTTAQTAPYLIQPHAFGHNVPSAPLRLSATHKIQLAEGLWTSPEKAALTNPLVTQCEIGTPVTYYHIECENYLKDNIMTEGMIVESLGTTKSTGGKSDIYAWNSRLNAYTRVGHMTSPKSKSA